jgi:hypothetical protein
VLLGPNEEPLLFGPGMFTFIVNLWNMESEHSGTSEEHVYTYTSTHRQTVGITKTTFAEAEGPEKV